jgi:hypothetical protein
MDSTAEVAWFMPDQKSLDLARKQLLPAPYHLTTTSASEISAAMAFLIQFYDPAVKGTDPFGRTLDQILAWKDVKLEHSHNYIQVRLLEATPVDSGNPRRAPISAS